MWGWEEMHSKERFLAQGGNSVLNSFSSKFWHLLFLKVKLCLAVGKNVTGSLSKLPQLSVAPKHAGYKTETAAEE